MHVVIEYRIAIMLEAIRAAAFARIKLITGEIPHYLPVSIACPDIPKSLVADVADMELFVSFVEEETAGRNQART